MEQPNARIMQKGDIVALHKENDLAHNKIHIGCTWGAAKETTLWELIHYTKDIDLDLSCVMFNKKGKLVDHIYSPLYIPDILKQFGLPKGKYISADNAMHHTGDDINGDSSNDAEDTDNESIIINLGQINPDINEIYFFLNNCGEEDFSEIPYARIRITEGTPDDPGDELAAFQLDSNAKYSGSTAVIMGRLIRTKNGDWDFQAIGDPFNDPFPGYTIHRLASDYAGKQ